VVWTPVDVALRLLPLTGADGTGLIGRLGPRRSYTNTPRPSRPLKALEALAVWHHINREKGEAR
jgi:hypothetical protein